MNARDIAAEVRVSHDAANLPGCEGETLDHLMDRLEGLIACLSFLPVQGDSDIAVRCRRAAVEAEILLDVVRGHPVPEQSARLIWRLVDSVARYFEEKTGIPVSKARSSGARQPPAEGGKAMNDIIPFDFEGAAVRVLDREGSPWFVLADVCRVLEIANPSNVAARLDDDEKLTLHNVEGRAGNGAQAFTIINESGLYSLVLTSRKAAAKRFKKWVTAEVLPTIRKTGSYSMAPGEEAMLSAWRGGSPSPRSMPRSA